MPVPEDEFPLLGALGLYAARIKADGNCLFKALSDQLYGEQTHHQAIRTQTIEYMENNKDYFKQFLRVEPGGGTRRNPKRKTAAESSTALPSAKEVDRAFNAHMKTMAQGGTWGDNIEIIAFSAAFGVAVKVWQATNSHMFGEGMDNVLHIAHHHWEHYSSIRSLNGPHDGLPNLQVPVLSEEDERKLREEVSLVPALKPKVIKTVKELVPASISNAIIEKILKQCKGDINEAVSKLLDMEEQASASSSQGSSIVEREADTEDEDSDAPNKKQNRGTNNAVAAQSGNASSSSLVPIKQEPVDSDAEEHAAASDNHSVQAEQNGGDGNDPENPPSRASSSEASVAPRIRITINGHRRPSYSPQRNGSSPIGINRKTASRAQHAQTLRLLNPGQRKENKKRAQNTGSSGRIISESDADDIMMDASTYDSHDTFTTHGGPGNGPVIINNIKTLYI
ncbi:MAG: hypothetical protein M1821_000883 [Bathelium mastoideum]|nr:MAG: hypothetical protein M1821_000883 [Bathelium mastoideum]